MLRQKHARLRMGISDICGVYPVARALMHTHPHAASSLPPFPLRLFSLTRLLRASRAGSVPSALTDIFGVGGAGWGLFTADALEKDDFIYEYMGLFLSFAFLSVVVCFLPDSRLHAWRGVLMSASSFRPPPTLHPCILSLFSFPPSLRCGLPLSPSVLFPFPISVSLPPRRHAGEVISHEEADRRGSIYDKQNYRCDVRR
jgi:hypothetical protein